MGRLFVAAWLLFCISASALLAQQATLNVNVANATNKLGVKYANVYLDSVFIASSPGNNGTYQFIGIKPGNYSLCVSHVGFQKFQQKITIKEGVSFLDIELSPLVDTLSPIVVTGTGTHYRLDNVPVQTEIITQKDIQEISGRGIEEIIANISSSIDFVSSSMGTNIKINGLGADYVVVLLDGKRLTGGVGGYTDISRISTDNIKQIEIVKGASSTLYGSDAIGGVINIITQKPKQKYEAANSTRVGAYGDFRQANSVSFNRDKFESKTSFSYKKTDGWQLNDMEYNSKWEANHDLPYLVQTYDMPVNKNWAYTISQHLGYDISKKINVYADLSWYEKTLYFPFKGNNYNYYYNNKRALLGWKYLLKGKNYIDFSADLSNYKYYTEYPNKYNESYYTPSGVITETYYPGDRFKNSEQITYLLQAKGVFQLNTKNELNIGAEVFGDFLESKYRLTKDNVHANTYSLYVQDDYKITARLNIVGGLRFINHDIFGFMVTPKLSVMYKLKPFTFRFNYANGFKSPTLKELYYYYESDRMGAYRLYLGNEGLEPQTSNYYSLSTEFKHKNIKASINIFHNRIFDMIDYKIIETSWDNERRGIEETKMRYNIAEARNTGADWHFTINLYKQFALACGYSYVDAKNITENIRFDGVSEHSATWKASWNKKWDNYGLNMTISGNYKSNRFYLEEDTRLTYANPYQLWKLTTTHTMGFIKSAEVKVFFGIDNVLDYVDDSPYGSHYGTLNPGRTFFAGINIKYNK